MEKKRINRNAAMIAAALASGIFLSSAVGMYAYFTNAEHAKNTFTVANNRSSPKEEFHPPDKLEPGVNSYQKAVCVENTGDIDCFVRVRVEFSDGNVAAISGFSSDSSASSGTYYSAIPDGIDADIEDESGDVVIESDPYVDHLPEGWEYIAINEDDELGGYYYYTEAIAPADETVNLFNYVCTYFATEGDVTAYNIYVYTESVETRDENGELFTGADAWKDAWDEFLNKK